MENAAPPTPKGRVSAATRTMSVVISPAGHRYDRTVSPPLPWHRMITRINRTIAETSDLRSTCGLVKNQGTEGSCTAHAGTSGAEWQFRRYFKKAPIFSPQFTYAEELIADGDFPNDNGSTGQTACEVAINKGFCELSLYPYVAGQINRPTASQEANARQWALGAYHGVAGSQVAASVLGDPTPWPVLIGFTVYDSFEGEWAIPGVMPLPGSGEGVLGGHEVLGVGYDIGDTPKLRPQGCPPAFLIQNSWGADWALSGFFWMPASILDASDTDIKIVHAGKPW